MTTTIEFDAIVAGHLCLDMFPRFNAEKPAPVAEIFRPGMLVDMGEMSVATGGAVSNTGVALTIFGCTVAFVAKVGDDFIGRMIVDLMAAKGDTRGIALAKAETSSYSVVLAPPGIDRMFLHCSGANHHFRASDIDFSLVKKARHFHFGYPTLMRSTFEDGGRELTAIFKGALEAGVSTSLDISLPDPTSPAGRADWPAIYRSVLPYVDIFVPSIEEAWFTLHPAEYLERKAVQAGAELIDHFTADDFSRIADECLALGCKMVALKAGHNGWYFKTAPAGAFKVSVLGSRINTASWAGRELWCPAFAVDRIASATGSGDTSIAAFLAAMLRGSPIEESLTYANCAGAMNLSAMDAASGLRSWDEMRAFIGRSSVRPVKQLPAAGWHWEKKSRCWSQN